MLQAYETRVGDGFVMSGNEALVVCSLPSHTAQFLQVVAWVTSDSVEIFPRQDPSAAGRDPCTHLHQCVCDSPPILLTCLQVKMVIESGRYILMLL